MTTVGFHMETSQGLILQAEAALHAGDEKRACEKAWGAAARAVESVAESRGWRRDTHADLFRAVNNIVRISGDPEIRALFSAANALRQNFYEGWLDYEYIVDSMADVKRLLTKLDAFMDADNNGAGA